MELVPKIAEAVSVMILSWFWLYVSARVITRAVLRTLEEQGDKAHGEE